MAHGARNWTQSLESGDGKYRLTIKPTAGKDSFRPVNENGVQRGYRPFVEFFEHRLKEIEILSGSEYGPVVTDDFILVPNPPSDQKAQAIEIVFRAKAVEG